MTDPAEPRRSLSWRDLACLPWFVWLAGGVIGLAGQVPREPGGSAAMPALLIGLAAVPGLVLIWGQRRAWLIRRGW